MLAGTQLAFVTHGNQLTVIHGLDDKEPTTFQLPSACTSKENNPAQDNKASNSNSQSAPAKDHGRLQTVKLSQLPMKVR